MTKIKSPEGNFLDVKFLYEYGAFNATYNLPEIIRSFALKNIITLDDAVSIINKWDILKEKFQSGKDFETMTEDEKGNWKRISRVIEIWVNDFFIPRALNYLCDLAYKQSYDKLKNKAERGDDEALFKLVKLFKNIEDKQEWVKRRYDFAKLTDDREFLRRYLQAQNEKVKPRRNIKPGIHFYLIMNREFVKQHDAPQIHAFFKEMYGLKLPKSEKSFYRLIRRMGFSTGRGKRGKRKETDLYRKTADIPLKEFAEEEGISVKRAKKIEKSALKKYREGIKKLNDSE